MSLRNYYKRAYKEKVRRLNEKNSPVIQWYYRLFWKPKNPSIPFLFDRYSKQHAEVFFIQIGANDGMEHDPLLKFIRRDGWKGLLIEPQKDVFSQLQKLHRHTPEVILENAAVSKTNETRELYHLSFSQSRWASGLSSFIRTSLEAQIESGYVEACAQKEGVSLPADKKDYIASTPVNCHTLDFLKEKHHLPNINLLQIDAEGYDYEIIKMVNFDKIYPDLISFESGHLSAEDWKACEELLHAKDYQIYVKGRDAIAIKSGCMDLEDFSGTLSPAKQ